jgi:small GTP-binding protein
VRISALEDIGSYRLGTIIQVNEAFMDQRNREQNSEETVPLNTRDTLDEEWETAIAFLDDSGVETGYEQACQTLRRFLDTLDLTPEERKGLDPSLDQLQAMLYRLEQTTVQIAVFGMVGRGKSSVLNALLGQPIFETGPLHGVTQSIERANWSVRQESIAETQQKALYVSLKGAGQSAVELIDTPGLDEINGEERERLARQVAQQADLILFIIAGDITKLEYQALCELRRLSKPMVLVFNKVDQYPDADRMAIYETIRDQRVRELLSPDEIVMTAASPVVTEAVRRPDGTVTIQHRRGRPDVEALKLKILNVLHHEGKAMTALNTMLFTDNLNEEVVQRKLTIRDEGANQVIWNSVMTKAIAIALNPLTAIDVLSGAVIDIVMIMTLSRLYGIEMTQRGALQLLQRMALGLGGITVSEMAATLGLSSLKGMLGLTIPATGGLAIAPYLSVAITQAGVAGVSTYGMGQVAKTYLANGASWGDNSPKVVIQDILSSLDETYILNRVKQELQEKLKYPHFLKRPG